LIGDSRRYDLVVPKFRDDNRNGIQDAGEPPLADIPFTLDLNRNNRYDPATEPLVRTDATGIALFPNLLPGTYSVLEVFDPSVNNPFPIPTGPNPVNFTVPGPTTVPSAVPTPVPTPVPSPIAPVPRTSASSGDPLTGGTVTGSSIPSDPLNNPGRSAADLVQASSADSLLAPQSAGVSSFVGSNIEREASSLVLSFLEENGLKESTSLWAGSTSGTWF
jgi:hypothetical protein